MDNIFTITLIFLGLIIGYISTGGKKSQTVRLLDMFILGPIMIYLGWYNINKVNKDNKDNKVNKVNKYNKDNTIFKLMNIILIFFGSGTITYNLKNYIKFV